MDHKDRDKIFVLKKKQPDCFDLFEVNRNRVRKEKARKDYGALPGLQSTHSEEITGEPGRAPVGWQDGCPSTPSSLRNTRQPPRREELLISHGAGHQLSTAPLLPKLGWREQPSRSAPLKGAVAGSTAWLPGHRDKCHCHQLHACTWHRGTVALQRYHPPAAPGVAAAAGREQGCPMPAAAST